MGPCQNVKVLTGVGRYGNSTAGGWLCSGLWFLMDVLIDNLLNKLREALDRRVPEEISSSIRELCFSALLASRGYLDSWTPERRRIAQELLGEAAAVVDDEAQRNKIAKEIGRLPEVARL